ncbi:response regulator [Cohnella pontilimi]|uniref:Response regulator n=1 Tax=Cohnella pontilimi TaxID=2564100 RepID=A0A4U0FHT8_9BACL|nr:response regulator [Cohnella pontilimi]
MAYRFLVVDDTNFMRKMASDCLKQFGYEVAGEAANGKDAVRLFEELRPDVVIMDLTMPELSGIDALKQILQINPEAVVLICSASNQKEQIFEALEAGAKGYLSKPFNPKRLQEVIQKYAVPFLVPSTTLHGEVDAAEAEVVMETAAAVEPADEPTTNSVDSIRRNEKMKSFVSRLMCNWQEETNEGTVHYSVICTESENSLLVEMNGDNNEKQVISFSLDGFRQLAGWLDDHLGSRTN